LNLHWQNKETARLMLCDKRLQSFLFQKGSLTRFIQQRCRGSFHVDLITESWCYPMPDEKHLLPLRNHEITFIRESWLKCNNQRLVYARTVIPRKTLKGKNQKLTRLGTKPLGKILFNDNTTYRTNMRYAKIPVNCELHKETTKGSDISSELWGRQSLFYIKNNPLLITEVFLPTILECSKN
jgi:chorismate lyase